jgi:pantoate--beta-alanine ligase
MANASDLPIVRDVAGLRTQVGAWRAAGLSVAVVPTMGALHAGHLSLVQLGLQQADRVVATLFVNPKQFGPTEDLARYPRMESEDAGKLSGAGCHLLYAPSVEVMYPDGFATLVRVEGLSEGLCGAARPGHFDGVSTVVSKLLIQVGADVAVFGEKDFQQLTIIRQLVRDLDIPTRIVAGPTQREADGLALSSRNAYLSDDERRIAAALPAQLQEGVAALENGAPADVVTARVERNLLSAGFQSVDYVELRDAVSLKPLSAARQPGRLLAAARLGSTRLIDNWPVAPMSALD